MSQLGLCTEHSALQGLRHSWEITCNLKLRLRGKLRGRVCSGLVASSTCDGEQSGLIWLDREV